jgi:hypothetical protein
MRYTVVWAPSAQDELACIWLRASDQQAVADAADDIDRLLRFSPTIVGQLQDNSYVLTVEPLVVKYTVNPDDCLVRVLEVEYHP